METTDYSKIMWQCKMEYDLGILKGNPFKEAEERYEERIYNEEKNKDKGFKEIENHMVKGEYYSDNEK